MKNYKTLEFEIRRCYDELREERANFSGHYNDNPYNGINVFGNGIYTVDINLDEIISDGSVSNRVKIGVLVMELCKLAQAHSDSIDNDENPIENVKLMCGYLLREISEGTVNEFPEFIDCVMSGFSDPVEFSSNLLKIYEKYVAVT